MIVIGSVMARKKKASFYLVNQTIQIYNVCKSVFIYLLIDYDYIFLFCKTCFKFSLMFWEILHSVSVIMFCFWEHIFHVSKSLFLRHVLTLFWACYTKNKNRKPDSEGQNTKFETLFLNQKASETTRVNLFWKNKTSGTI